LTGANELEDRGVALLSSRGGSGGRGDGRERTEKLGAVRSRRASSPRRLRGLALEVVPDGRDRDEERGLADSRGCRGRRRARRRGPRRRAAHALLAPRAEVDATLAATWSVIGLSAWCVPMTFPSPIATRRMPEPARLGERASGTSAARVGSRPSSSSAQALVQVEAHDRPGERSVDGRHASDLLAIGWRNPADLPGGRCKEEALAARKDGTAVLSTSR
jgi:hypothetical protein